MIDDVNETNVGMIWKASWNGNVPSSLWYFNSNPLKAKIRHPEAKVPTDAIDLVNNCFWNGRVLFERLSSEFWNNIKG